MAKPPVRSRKVATSPVPSPQLQTLKSEFFRALAHPIRIRLLEVMVTTPESSVQELQQALDIEQPIVSQQLAKLRAAGIVLARNRGAATRYAVSDPLLKELLAVARQILNRRLLDTQMLLHELAGDGSARPARRLARAKRR